MRKREYHWSLYHAKEKNQLDGLRTDQVEVVFTVLPKEQRKEWFVWKESAPSWKPFEDFPQLLASLRKADDRTWETPPLPDRGEVLKPRAPTQSHETTKTISKEDLSITRSIDDAEFSLLRDEVGEDRHNVRFQRRIEVRILAGEKTYQNSTVDISLKGMNLKNTLPPSLPNYYTVEIKNDEQIIPLVCSTIATADGSPSNRIRIEANEYSNALFTFLLSGVR